MENYFIPSNHNKDECKNCGQLFFHCECGKVKECTQLDSVDKLLSSLTLRHVVEGLEFIEVSQVKNIIEQVHKEYEGKMIEFAKELPTYLNSGHSTESALQSYLTKHIQL